MIDISNEQVEFCTYGYEYARKMEQEIANNPNHTLSLESAIEYIKFYGLEIADNQGILGFVGKTAKDRINKALVWEGYNLVKE